MESEDISGKGDKAVGSGPHGAPRPHQQKILQACRLHADQYLVGLFKQVVDRIDEVLLDRSNQGGAEANAYLEAARELRTKRQDIARAFFEKAARNIKSRLNYTAYAASSAKKVNAQSGDLSLLDEQELEESLAIDGLVGKANDRFRNELYALSQRLNFLISGAKYQDETQPFCPEIICHAFRDAFHGIGWKVEIKLIVYKIFDKAVMKGLGDFYQQMNALMSDAGILANIKLGTAKRSTGGGAQGSPQASTGGAEAQGKNIQDGAMQEGMPAGESGGATAADVYQTLQQLMNVKKYGGAPSGGEVTNSGGGFPGGMPVAGVSKGPSLAADELVRGLSLLQHAPLPGDAGGAIHVTVIKDALLEQMGQIGDGRGINPAHDNTIDVIGMIFEFIVDDPSIPTEVKNLLNRLQVPILKVAIVDKGFFTNKAHAARRLLNVLGHAGNGWNDNSEEARRLLFEKMEYVVNRVLNEFEQDPRIFSELLLDFSDFLAKEGEEIIEEPADAADDQAQQVAPERYAFESIEARLEGAEVPAALRDFLRGTWRDVLQHVLDTAGHDSEDWRRHEQTIDDLMWSVEPKTTADDRRKMVISLPRLLGALREGMALVGSTPQEMDALIDALEPIHMACLRGDKPPMEETKGDERQKPAHDVSSSSSDVYGMIRSIQEGMRKGDYSRPSEHDEPLGADVSDLEKELLGVDTSPADTEEELPEEESIDDEFTTRAADMKLGTWLEFTINDKTRRGKLAWKSVVMGEYVFVDRKYKVVAEKTLAELAADLRHGRVVPVENVAMFDRALDKVMNGLMSGGGAAN